MTSRLDELFSPEKLRQNWQRSSAPELVSSPTDNANLNIQSHYLQLQRLVAENFSDAAKLTVIFQNLTDAIELAFGLDAKTPADAKQRQIIVSMLEELEELLSAMDLPRWGA